VGEAVGEDDGCGHHRVDVRPVTGQPAVVEQPVEDEQDHRRRSGEDHHRHAGARRQDQRMGDGEDAEDEGQRDQDRTQGRVHGAVQSAGELIRGGGAVGGHARGGGANNPKEPDERAQSTCVDGLSDRKRSRQLQ
jgi:hypothetical protein